MYINYMMGSKGIFCNRKKYKCDRRQEHITPTYIQGETSPFVQTALAYYSVMYKKGLTKPNTDHNFI